MLKHVLIVCLTLFTTLAWTQTPATSNYSVAAPKVLLLVYQQFLPGKASARQTLEVDVARNFDRIAVPMSWIEMESLTGPTQALFVDPVGSFAEIEKTGNVLAQVYGSRPDLAQSQQQIEEMVANSRTVTAVLRDDLSTNAAQFNLGKARYLQIRVVQVRPERERDLLTALSNARTSAQSDKTLAVYQVNAGLAELTFYFLEPLRSMQEVDQGLAAQESVVLNMTTSSDTNLYGIHPEMSHVGKDFAASDPKFWGQVPTP
jgi:hypothetical protein